MLSHEDKCILRGIGRNITKARVQTSFAINYEFACPHSTLLGSGSKKNKCDCYEKILKFCLEYLEYFIEAHLLSSDTMHICWFCSGKANPDCSTGKNKGYENHCYDAFKAVLRCVERTRTNDFINFALDYILTICPDVVAYRKRYLSISPPGSCINEYPIGDSKVYLTQKKFMPKISELKDRLNIDSTYIQHVVAQSFQYGGDLYRIGCVHNNIHAYCIRGETFGETCRKRTIDTLSMLIEHSLDRLLDRREGTDLRVHYMNSMPCHTEECRNGVANERFGMQCIKKIMVASTHSYLLVKLLLNGLLADPEILEDVLPKFKNRNYKESRFVFMQECIDKKLGISGNKPSAIPSNLLDLTDDGFSKTTVQKYTPSQSSYKPNTYAYHKRKTGVKKIHFYGGQIGKSDES